MAPLLPRYCRDTAWRGGHRLPPLGRRAGLGAEALGGEGDRAGSDGVATTPTLNTALPDLDMPLSVEDRRPSPQASIARDRWSSTPKAERDLKRFEAAGFGDLPICMAKTPYSFSADETLLGAPEGFVLPVREVRLSAGAGFVVVICGEVMTMPGLPKVPSAENIRLDGEGRIEGLF